MTVPGTRVFAVRSDDQENIYLYGFGVYVGDEQRPGTKPWEEVTDVEKQLYVDAITHNDENPLDLSFFYDQGVASGKFTREQADIEIAEGDARWAKEKERPLDDRARDLYYTAAKNPKIELDGNRGTVWGCECWWGPLEGWEKIMGGRNVVEVDIALDRATAGIEEGRNFAVS